MLVLSRKISETIMIGDNIEIVVTRIERDTVRLAFNAPREIRILRGELFKEPPRQPEQELPGAPQ